MPSIHPKQISSSSTAQRSTYFSGTDFLKVTSHSSSCDCIRHALSSSCVVATMDNQQVILAVVPTDNHPPTFAP